MVYNYTKPRGPIAAQYTSPGPAYGLPVLVGYSGHDPRSVHSRAPAYQFGTHRLYPDGSCGPGPSVYLPDSRVSRTGTEGSPKYSIYGKRKELTPFRTPGPGTYSAGDTRDKSPSFSIGGMFPTRSVDCIPAPNAYNPPSLIGRTVVSNKRQAPQPSIYGRSKTGGFYEDFAKTPGPGSYQAVSADVSMRRQPSFSLLGRNMPPGDNTQRPGPGAHSPERVNVNRRQLPSYSFGIRHSEYVAPLISTLDFDY